MIYAIEKTSEELFSTLKKIQIRTDGLFMLYPITVMEKQKMSIYWMIYYTNKGLSLKELMRGLIVLYPLLIRLESLTLK